MLPALALTTVLFMLLAQADREFQQKRNLSFWFVAGLCTAYIVGLFLPHLQFMPIVGMYAGAVISGGLLVLGTWYWQQFFYYHGVGLRSELYKFSSRITRLRSLLLPYWIFAVIGLVIGFLEPVQLGARQQLLASLPSGLGEQIIAISWPIFLALLPVLLLLAIGWLHHATAGKNTSQPVRYLLYGTGLVISSWVGVLVAGQFIIF